MVVAGMDPDRLVIDEIMIGRAGYVRQMEFKGRGKTGIRKKPYCYCAVYVREIQPTDVYPPPRPQSPFPMALFLPPSPRLFRVNMRRWHFQSDLAASVYLCMASAV
jgi:hypothetical protein